MDIRSFTPMVLMFLASLGALIGVVYNSHGFFLFGETMAERGSALGIDDTPATRAMAAGLCTLLHSECPDVSFLVYGANGGLHTGANGGLHVTGGRIVYTRETIATILDGVMALASYNAYIMPLRYGNEGEFIYVLWRTYFVDEGRVLCGRRGEGFMWSIY